MREIKKNSTEMPICLEMLNSETKRSLKLLGGWLLRIFRISQIIHRSSINQHKKLMTSKYQLLKNANQLFLWFFRLAIYQEYPRE